LDPGHGIASEEGWARYTSDSRALDLAKIFSGAVQTIVRLAASPSAFWPWSAEHQKQRCQEKTADRGVETNVNQSPPDNSKATSKVFFNHWTKHEAQQQGSWFTGKLSE